MPVSSVPLITTAPPDADRLLLRNSGLVIGPNGQILIAPENTGLCSCCGEPPPQPPANARVCCNNNPHVCVLESGSATSVTATVGATYAAHAVNSVNGSTIDVTFSVSGSFTVSYLQPFGPACGGLQTTSTTLSSPTGQLIYHDVPGTHTYVSNANRLDVTVAGIQVSATFVWLGDINKSLVGSIFGSTFSWCDITGPIGVNAMSVGDCTFKSISNGSGASTNRCQTTASGSGSASDSHTPGWIQNVNASFSVSYSGTWAPCGSCSDVLI